MTVVEKIDSEEAYVRVLCNRVAERFKNPPRLRVARAQEERAASRLYKTGYKVSRLKDIMTWAHETSDWDGWQKVLTSVTALAHYLLEPKNVADCLESRFDVWLLTHPPMCPHGRLLENKATCPGCQADPKCKNHCEGGVITVSISDTKDMALVCDCAAAKIGLPSLKEQIRAEREKREKRPPTISDELEDGE